MLGDRLFVLPEASLEEYVPEALYKRAGLVKSEVLTDMEGLKADRPALATKKADTAKALAAARGNEDLIHIDIIRQAVQKAIDLAT